MIGCGSNHLKITVDPNSMDILDVVSAVVVLPTIEEVFAQILVGGRKEGTSGSDKWEAPVAGTECTAAPHNWVGSHSSPNPCHTWNHRFVSNQSSVHCLSDRCTKVSLLIAKL